jgi:4-amino-4-deoxy-L-arabinose transferase-like glycosyltransferase
MSAPLSPSGSKPERLSALPAPLIAVIVATMAVRLIVGAHVHLTEDEAYYRLWSMAPALGYYDHPPMIACWIWLGRSLLGDTALGVRLIPILACGVTTLVVFDMAALAGAGQAVAVRSAIWFNAMLLVGAGGLLAVPDAPASLFWASALWCALRAERASSIPWWIGAGLMAGLATLSKYSALFLGPGILTWLFLTPRGRSQLNKPGPWLAAAVAAGLFTLNVVWNADHGWLTFARQFGRIRPTHFAPQHLPEFVGEQILLLNPLIEPFLIGAVAARSRPSGEGGRVAPFLASSAPFVIYLLIHSLHDQVQAHWPAPIYPALAVCAAIGAERLGRAPRWSRLRVAAPVCGFLLCGALALYLLAPARWSPRAADPGLPLQGWPLFARAVDRARLAAGALWVGTASYALTAELADEADLRAPVFQLDERARYRDIPIAEPNFASPGLVVDLPRRIDVTALRRCFTTVVPLGDLARGPRGGAAVRYAALLVAGPRRPIEPLGCW